MIRSFFNILILLCAVFITPGDIHADENRTNVITSETNRPTLLQPVSLIRTNERLSRNSAVSVQGLQGGHGSGTYIEHNNHYAILTARHVIDKADIFYIVTATEKVVGQVIWKSETHDIALLLVPRLDSRSAVTLSRNRMPLNIGHEVVYSGYPASYDLITTRAYVNGHAAQYKATLLHGFVWFGYSGSGVFNSSGELVGVIVAVGVERLGEHPQVLEDMVYIHELRPDHISRIKHSL